MIHMVRNYKITFDHMNKSIELWTSSSPVLDQISFSHIRVKECRGTFTSHKNDYTKTKICTPCKFSLQLWGHSRLRYYFWVSNGKRTFLDNFTCLVCLDLYCEAYFGSYLHFILHIEYTYTVNLEGIGSSKISFWFLKGHLGVLS
jgi:hypothetical protein